MIQFEHVFKTNYSSVGPKEKALPQSLVLLTKSTFHYYDLVFGSISFPAANKFCNFRLVVSFRGLALLHQLIDGSEKKD